MKIEDLQIRNASLEAMKQGDLIDKYDAVLIEKNKLVQQVKEMEEFLADYGLKWIGKENHQGKFNADQINSELAHKGPNYRNNLPPEIDTVILS